MLDSLCILLNIDDNITSLLSIGSAVNRNCESYVSFNMLAKNMFEDTKKLYDCTQKYKGVVGFFKRVIKRKVR